MGALSASGRPLSAYDLLDRLRPTGVAAPLTVYRALDKLVASGKVHRIESLNAFVACRTGHDHADHGSPDAAAAPRSVGFTICDRCGLVEEFVDPALFPRLDRSLLKKGFAPRTTAVEVHGLCAGCRDAASGAAGARGGQAHPAEP